MLEPLLRAIIRRLAEREIKVEMDIDALLRLKGVLIQDESCHAGDDVDGGVGLPRYLIH